MSNVFSSLSSKIDVHNTNICSHDITMTESRDNKRGLASADEETRERVLKLVEKHHMRKED
jgi:hypothetical protein